MTILMWTNVGLAGANLVLVAVIAFVYARNYTQVRSPFTLGLLSFSVFLLLHNGLVLYHLLTMMTVYAQLGEVFLLVENLVQLVALGALVRATLR
jgi:hypothetical protein